MTHQAHVGTLVVTLIAVAVAPLAAQAPAESARPVDRRFTFVEETLHGALPGQWEVEQWARWRTQTDNDRGFDRLDFKTELEYGIDDGLHLAIDLAEWHVEDSAAVEATRFDAVAAELKWRVADPRRDTLGIAWKTELGVGPIGLEWENALVVDKIVDRWAIGYNLVVEAGWEGDKLFEFGESDGGLRQALGVSYELRPSLLVGAELVHDVPLPEWKSGEPENLSLGPNFAWRGNEWALTATPMFLLSGGDDEPVFELRVIFEVDF